MQDAMDLKNKIELVLAIIATVSVVVSVVAVFTTVRNKLDFLTQLFQAAVARFDIYHKQHFDHAANTGIHQESMSKDMLALHFENLKSTIAAQSSQLAKHVADDMEVLRDIRDELKRIHAVLPSRLQSEER